jgi:hypothetical protein
MHWKKVKIFTGNTGADYGNAGGSATMLTLKSGTNAYHGSAFEFLRNNVLDANGYFRNLNRNTATRLNFKRNIFGGTVGGPIKKNKIFFFADYEGTQQRDGGPTTASVATQALRNGDLSSLVATGSRIIDPPTVSRSRTMSIPASSHRQPGRKETILRFQPVSSSEPGRHWTIGHHRQLCLQHRDTLKNFQGDVKVDFRLTDKDSVFARWSMGHYEQFGSRAALPTSLTSANILPTTSAVVNWTRSFSPTIVNEARAAFSRVAIDEGVPVDWSGLLTANGNQAFGIPGGQPYAGLSSVNLGNGLTGVGAGGAAGSTVDNKFIYYDNLTWQKGKHLIKMGAQFTRYQNNRYYAGNNGALGIFTYDGTFSGRRIFGLSAGSTGRQGPRRRGRQVGPALLAVIPVRSGRYQSHSEPDLERGLALGIHAAAVRSGGSSGEHQHLHRRASLSRQEWQQPRAL